MRGDLDAVILLILSECAGIAQGDVIDDTNVERFRGCTIITSGGIFIASSANFK